MICKDCEYPAEDIYDLGEREHKHEFHGENSKNTFDCYYFEESFTTKRYLMVHRKKEHIEKVNTCRYFLQETCNFDENCLYKHKHTKKVLEMQIKCDLSVHLEANMI